MSRISGSTIARAARALPEPAHRCRHCGAGLEIAAGYTFSTRAGRPREHRERVWCQMCNGYTTFVYRMSGSTLRVAVEKEAT